MVDESNAPSETPEGEPPIHAAGSGEAYDAQAITVDNAEEVLAKLRELQELAGNEDLVSFLEAMTSEARAVQEAAAPQKRIEAAQVAVDKAKEGVVAAEEALKRVTAENEAWEAALPQMIADRAERKAALRAEANAAAAATEPEGN